MDAVRDGIVAAMAGSSAAGGSAQPPDVAGCGPWQPDHGWCAVGMAGIVSGL